MQLLGGVSWALLPSLLPSSSLPSSQLLFIASTLPRRLSFRVFFLLRLVFYITPGALWHEAAGPAMQLTPEGPRMLFLSFPFLPKTQPRMSCRGDEAP